MSKSNPDIDPAPLSPYVALAWERNRDPILQALQSLFPDKGSVLELASGSGAHISYFAPRFPEMTFQPSDRDASVFEAIKANRSRAGTRNVADPVRIDLTEPETWSCLEGRLYDAIFAINVFHLAPPLAAEGFAEIAQRVLRPGASAALYGPFTIGGRFTTASNEAFDRSLRQAGVPGWGLKDVLDLETAARARGLILKRRLDLPANNFMLVFVKAQ